jgi:putative heme transporter
VGVTAERVEQQRTPSPRLFETGELPPILRDPSHPTPRKPFKPVRFGIKTGLFLVVFYFFVLPLIPGFRRAASELLDVQPLLLIAGIGLQVGSWWAYAFLTRAALGDARHLISPMRMFRIGMSSKALLYIVPAGNAAGSALGYRLLTLSGVRGADAGFAMATAGIGSAVVLNVMLWLALLISIPIRGANGLYAIAAVAGVVVMMIAVGIVLGLIHGQARAERIVRAIAQKFRWDGDKATAAVRQVGTRVEDLLDDKQLMRRVICFAALAWVLDASSLWVFLRAFGGTLDPDALFVAFGLANVIGVIPITPGGLGIVEWVYIPTLVGFGLSRAVATLGVGVYRISQFFLPIAVGGLCYGSLRFGPWKIERRDRLARLRTLAHDSEDAGESQLEFLMRAWPKRVVRKMPDVEVPDRRMVDADRADTIVALEDRLHHETGDIE